MNELNKLIEQYPGDKIRLELAFLETKKDPYYWSVQLQEFLKFIQWLSTLATRPTCGVEQRKFLDELKVLYVGSHSKEEGIYDFASEYYGDFLRLRQNHFTADLSKVVQGE